MRVVWSLLLWGTGDKDIGPLFFLFLSLCILTGEEIDFFDMEQFQRSFKRILQRALKNVRTQVLLGLYEI